jgi:hypothetical protein
MAFRTEGGRVEPREWGFVPWRKPKPKPSERGACACFFPLTQRVSDSKHRWELAPLFSSHSSLSLTNLW